MPASDLISYLSRGGTGYYWVKNHNTKHTIWFQNGQIPPPPDPANADIYFGVHPCQIAKTEHDRALIVDIAAVNCFFAEFDIKDFGGDRAATLAHIRSLPIPPSVIVASGGGFHCYWFINKTIYVDETNREEIRRLQAAWVLFVGGDSGAKDLSRVLRVPGTLNHKYEPVRQVELIHEDYGLTYPLSAFYKLLPQPAPPPAPIIPASTSNHDAAYWLDKAYSKLGSMGRNETAYWLASQLRDNVVSKSEAESIMHSFQASVQNTKADPFTWTEALATLNSAYRNTPRQPATFRSTSVSHHPRIPTSTPPQPPPMDDLDMDDLPPMPEPDEDEELPDPPAADDGKKKKKKAPRPDDNELAERLCRLHTDICYGLKDWRRYKNGVWSIVDETEIANLARQVACAARFEGVEVTSARVKSIVYLAHLLCEKPDDLWDRDENLLVCQNGVIHIRTRQLRPHSPLDYITSGVPYKYDPAATCPSWDLALTAISPEEAEFLAEYTGLCMTHITKYDASVWLIGPPGSGKSTIVEGIQSVVGEGRSVQFSLPDMEKSRFALANLAGKTLAFASENPGKFFHAASTINDIVSGVPIRCERKFRDAVDIRPTVKVLWAMEKFPRIPDNAFGMFRRLKVINFYPLPRNQIDPDIRENVKTVDRSGILNWALDGLSRLMARGGFDIPDVISTRVDELKQRNDIPAVFIDECCVRGENLSVQSSELYEAYRDWCKRTEHEPQSSTTIPTEWERLGFVKKKTNTGARWIGLRLADRK